MTVLCFHFNKNVSYVQLPECFFKRLLMAGNEDLFKSFSEVHLQLHYRI